VPYLIGHVGVAAYGLVPIAGLMTQYASLVAQSISTSVNRYLTIAIQKNDLIESNKIYSTAFILYSCLGFLQLPILWVVVKNIENVIDVPSGLHEDAVALIFCSAIAFIVNLVSSVYSVTLYATNRLDIVRMLDIARYLLRIFGIVSFFLVLSPKLKYVGYVDLIASTIVFVLQYFIAKKSAPYLKVKIKYCDYKKVVDLLGMGGWLLVNNIGALLFLRTDIWICNRFVGVEASGHYAAIMQWPALVRSGGIVISGLIAPMITIYYANSEFTNLLRLGKISVRVFSILLAIFIGVLCVNGPFLLRWWLGESFVYLAPLMFIMLSHLIINVGVMPLLNIQAAMNKVRFPALITLSAGIINIIVSIVLVKSFDLGIYGVALGGAIVLTLKNAIFTPVYVAKLLGAPLLTFIRPCILPLGVFSVLTSAGALIHHNVDLSSIQAIFMLSIGLVVLGFMISWLLLEEDERRMVLVVVRGNRNQE